MSKKCPACGGQRFFQTGIRVEVADLRLDLGLADGLPVRCSVCLDCGNVLLRVSGSELEHLNFKARALEEAERQKPSKEHFREL